MPRTFGLPKPWLFIFDPIVAYFKRRTAPDEERVSLVTLESDTEVEEREVAQERERIHHDSVVSSAPIRIVNLRKIYPGKAGYVCDCHSRVREIDATVDGADADDTTAL
jgi:hypothetical protein